MKRGKLKVATCQFAVSASIGRNAATIKRQILRAKKRGAGIAHFPETALSGYAGVEYPNWDGFEWDRLQAETEAICLLARQKRIWLILGSAHRLTGTNQPHNCLYIINDQGRLVGRYDKRFCTGGDLKFYSPGDHFAVFTINGVRCGALICYDVRFPELYREYKKLGVELMFHSFHNARGDGPKIHTEIMPASLAARAATNYMFVSANNSSQYYQQWSSRFIHPDGHTQIALTRHRAGITVNLADTHKQYYDAAGKNRDRSMAGVLNTGMLVNDPRSRNRTTL
ncbi:carbon-nitrogen hydrolase family protein [Planctomycetota bacterium]